MTDPQALLAEQAYDLLAFLIEGLPERPNAVGMYSLGAVSTPTIHEIRAILKATGR